MKYLLFTLAIGIIFMFTACINPVRKLTYKNPDSRILFLHHSTGNNVWYGDIDPSKRFYIKRPTCAIPRLLKSFNDQNGFKISIEDRIFPKGKPYPWENYPYDYYNIWVKNSGDKPYLEEPTLEMLTREFNIIVIKHCFPVSTVLEDDLNPDVNSNKRTLVNYKLQYDALKSKLYQFPKTKFIVWTGAALVASQTNEEQAKRAKEFADWVKTEWDLPEDNIYIFDFREIETEGGLYLKQEYAVSESNSHPNRVISMKAANLFVERLIQVIKDAQ